jgi:hypothetical protein
MIIKCAFVECGWKPPELLDTSRPLEDSRQMINHQISSVGASYFYKKCGEVKDVRRAMWMLR